MSRRVAGATSQPSRSTPAPIRRSGGVPACGTLGAAHRAKFGAMTTAKKGADGDKTIAEAMIFGQSRWNFRLCCALLGLGVEGGVG